MQAFFAYLEEQKHFVQTALSKNQPMNDLTEDEKARSQNATHCDCCQKELGNKKCRSHNLQSGALVNILCNSCNLQYKNASRYVKKSGQIIGSIKNERANFYSDSYSWV